MSRNLISICVAGYLFGAAVTFGQVENRFGQMPRDKNDPVGISYVGAFVAAAVWPLYWPLRIADEVFDPKGFSW